MENSLWKKKESEEEKLKLKENGKQISINCASEAYMSHKLDASYSNYENIITEFYNSGASMGQKNHSKEFARLYLLHMISLWQKQYLVTLWMKDY